MVVTRAQARREQVVAAQAAAEGAPLTHVEQATATVAEREFDSLVDRESKKFFRIYCSLDPQQQDGFLRFFQISKELREVMKGHEGDSLDDRISLISRILSKYPDDFVLDVKGSKLSIKMTVKAFNA